MIINSHILPRMISKRFEPHDLKDDLLLATQDPKLNLPTISAITMDHFKGEEDTDLFVNWFITCKLYTDVHRDSLQKYFESHGYVVISHKAVTTLDTDLSSRVYKLRKITFTTRLPHNRAQEKMIAEQKNKMNTIPEEIRNFNSMTGASILSKNEGISGPTHLPQLIQAPESPRVSDKVQDENRAVANDERKKQAQCRRISMLILMIFVLIGLPILFVLVQKNFPLLFWNPLVFVHSVFFGTHNSSSTVSK